MIMKVQIFKLLEKNGFILYQREKTKAAEYSSWPKYFITSEGSKDYFKDFNTLREAKKEFKQLTAKIEFNFQIRPLTAPLNWEGIPVNIKQLKNRSDAIILAKRAAKILKAEIRLTVGNWKQASGAYIR